MSRCITDFAQATADLAEMTARKDGAYLERNRCVALIARMALASGWRAGIAHTAIEGWSDDWHGCVYIDLPTGQVSWHYHDSQAHLFADLPDYTGAWDGHDTPEKYRRVDAACVPALATGRANLHATVQRMEVRPGDTVVIGFKGPLTTRQLSQLQSAVRYQLARPDVNVLVLDCGATVQTVLAAASGLALKGTA